MAAAACLDSPPGDPPETSLCCTGGRTCLAWPGEWQLPVAGTREGTVTKKQRRVLAAAEALAAHWLKPYQKSGIRPSMLVANKALSKRAEETLCLRVQVIRNQVFVVGEKTSRLLDMQLHRCDSAPISGDKNENFCPERIKGGSRRGDGAAGCRYQYRTWERHRMTLALRLLHAAASRSGGLPDCELRLCADDTCHGVWETPPRPRPLFTMSSCLDAPTLPLPQWNAEWAKDGGRDVDLGEWDRVLHERANRSSRALERAAWRCRQSVAVFRGSANQLHTYNSRWGADRRLQRSKTTAANWNVSGRWALAQHKLSTPDLLNVRLSVLRRAHSIFEATGRPARYRQLVQAVSSDLPATAPLEAQARHFKYVLHLEGHGGWADRLKHLLLSGATVIKQDMGAVEWFEPLLRPGEHYLPVESDLSNLTAVIISARAHDSEARQVAMRSVEWSRRFMSATMVVEYTMALYAGYAGLFRSPAPLKQRADAVRFSCWPAIVNVSDPGCDKHAMAGRQLTDCGFVSEEQHSALESAGHGAPPRKVFNSIRAALLYRQRSDPSRRDEITFWPGGTNESHTGSIHGRNILATRTRCVTPGWV